MPCKRSSAVPIPFGVGFQFLGHAVSLRQLRHDQLHAVSCRFVNLSAILSYVHPAIGYFFVWRRERDSSGGTGAVPPPARGTKKTSTGRFFASLRSAVPFESLPLSLHKQKKHPYWVLFCLAQRKGFEPLLRFPVNTISSRAPSTSSAISASRSNIIQHFFVHCKRNLILRIKIV